jgi:hypothetical protein
MRLTLAATLLTQAIPAASSSSPSKNGGGVLLKKQYNKNLKMRHLQAMKRLGKVPAIESSLLQEDPSIEDDLFLVNKPQVGAPLLKNSKKVECDPSSQDELDVGILSCGSAGQYFCKESEESSLGGFCIIEGEDAASVSRVLYDFSGGFCDPDDGNFQDDLNCNCDGLDSDITGKITCLVYDRCCFEEVANPFCGSFSLDVDFVEGLPVNFVTCYSFTSPYEMTECYSRIYDSNRDQTCEHTINDEACSSCAMQLVDPNDPNPELCSVFDCTNTAVADARAGSTCNGTYPLPILDFLNGEEIDNYEPVCGVDPTTGAPSGAPSGAPTAADGAPSGAPTAADADGAASVKAKSVLTVISVFAGLFSFVVA